MSAQFGVLFLSTKYLSKDVLAKSQSNELIFKYWNIHAGYFESIWTKVCWKRRIGLWNESIIIYNLIIKVQF